MRYTQLTLGVILATVLSIASPILAANGDPFDGSWKVKITPDTDGENTGEREFDDTLVFADGKFIAKAFESHGFKPTPYEFTIRGVSIAGTFTSFPVSAKEGKAEWSGNATGNEISGKIVWTKKDGKVMRYTFTGKKSES